MAYLIGEIGQNHNGSVDIAKLIIDEASKDVLDPLFKTKLKGFDAVKLTKRDLKEELSASQMNKPYSSPHSFGETYGKHREALELSFEEHFELFQYSKTKNLDFVETLCSIGCIDMLKLFTPDKLKVASRDLTNLPLLSAMAETKIPIILSTGMGGQLEIDQALNVITKYHSNISILHCLSEYPSQYKNINLNTILYLKKKYPQFTIGYSDHSIGISTPVAAVAMGAKIIEKHITLNRNMKGTDQAGSLGIDGISRLLRDIRNLEASFGSEDIFISEAVKSAQEKLERSISTNKALSPGHKITLEDIHMLSPGTGYKWSEKEQILGKIVKTQIPANETISSDHIQ